MYSLIMYSLFSLILVIFTPSSCSSEFISSPSLVLYSPHDALYLDVIVKRVGANLTLDCEMRGDTAPLFVWNYVPANKHQLPTQILPTEPRDDISRNGSIISRVFKASLAVSDSGRYVCTAPPFSAAKYIVVQPNTSVKYCVTGSFACEKRCVLASSVCDGRPDCLLGEDEHPDICGVRPCSRPERVNCSSGACIPLAACCPRPSPLCSEHACCAEYRRSMPRIESYELIPPVEDRHAPDDYGFIQSTIYTVTACALIFMIAVVLLVSAICKMHMKRAALRSYAHAESNTRAHYNMHYAQRHRFPPCYEASDLLEQAAHSPSSPVRDTQQCMEELTPSSPTSSEHRNTRLSALASVFSSRYRQVPTQCTEVEMNSVGSFCEPTPCMDADRHRLTLQLGRFHLSIPSFRRSSIPRPDTPNVAEINIDDLDFVRLNSNDTYTLNGRTIRLLGGNFENYPMLGGSNPPPYNEAMRHKLYGPPPEYLSRDRLNTQSSVDEQARSNIEMPPGYEELNGNEMGRLDEATNIAVSVTDNGNVINDRELSDVACGVEAMININENSADNDTSLNANNGNSYNITENAISVNVEANEGNVVDVPGNTEGKSFDLKNGNVALSGNIKIGNGNGESLNSIIDNLPAIDSDVNANDEVLANVNNNAVA